MRTSLRDHCSDGCTRRPRGLSLVGSLSRVGRVPAPSSSQPGTITEPGQGSTTVREGWLFEKEFRSGNLWEISGDLAHSNRARKCGCSSLPTHGVS